MKTAEEFIDNRQQKIFDLLAPLRLDIPLSKEEQKQLSEIILVADEHAIGIQTLMIEFAKYHVEEALKAKVKAMKKESEEDSSFSLGELDAFTKEAYPLNKII